jgi:hypothetical protein
MRRHRLLLVVGAVVLLPGFALFLWLASPVLSVSMEDYRHLIDGLGDWTVIILCFLLSLLLFLVGQRRRWW